MKRHAHSAFWFLYWGLAVLVFLVAIFLLSVRLFITDLSDYRQDIEKILSEHLGARVHIADIQGAWSGADPVISIKSLSVDGLSGGGGLSLALLEGEVALDPLSSLKHLSPIFSTFDLSGLTVRYHLPSRTTPQDEAVTPDQASLSSQGAGLLELLLLQRTVNIENTQIVVQQESGNEIAISPIQLSLQHDGVLHQLKINADLITAEGNADINFIAEVEGDPRQQPTQFYFNLAGLSEQLLNPWLSLADLTVDRLRAEQEIWGQFNAGKLTYMSGKTGISAFKFGEYAFEDFSLHTALLRRDQGYQLQVNDLVLSGEKQRLALPSVSLDFSRSGWRFLPKHLMLDRVDLKTLSTWVTQQAFVPESALQILKSLAPAGVIENLRVDWANGEGVADFALNADLHNVSINAWDDVPAIAGINGLLQADLQGGAIHLTSDRFSMMYPTLFDYRWDYGYANGVIGWRFEDQGVVVASQLLNLKNDALAAAGRFSIYLPFDRDHQPLLNLQIGLQKGEGEQAKYYIPPKEVGQETYAWLVDAIKAGQIKQAGFVLNGVTRARLDDYQMPVVQMFFDIENAEFEYQPGWPSIKDANTFVFFRNGELIAEAFGGTIYDSRIGSAWVHLPDTTDKLYVAGDVAGRANDLQKLLTQTPLKVEVGDDLAAWQMQGEAQTLVDIALPLVGKLTPQVQVTSTVLNGGFTSVADKIDFKDIQGSIVYDSTAGLSAKKLTAKLFDKPVTASIQTAKQKTQVRINGAIESSRLRQWLDLDLLKIAKGSLSYVARLDMCPEKRCNQLVINSDLKGLELKAPVGLGKSAAQTMPLSLVSDLGRQYQDGKSAVRLNLNDQLRGVMINDGSAVERARFTFGGQRPELPDSPGIWIDGTIPSVDFDELSAFLNESGLLGAEATTAGGSANDGSSLFREASLSVGTFTFDQHKLENLRVDFSPRNEDWLLALDSPQLAGTIVIPHAVAPINVHLRHVHYQSSDEPTAETEKSVDYRVDTEKLPNIDFTIESLVANEKPMGRWSFALRPSTQGAQLENIKADLLGAEIDAQLRWDNAASELTDLTVKLSSQDFGKVLQAWGYADAIETKSLDAYLQLTWAGAPWAFAIADTDGEMQFTAKQGRLLDVGNSGNFLRVFGILNLQSIGRRLRLDFSDLFKSGVAFDEMKASYRIKKGIAHTLEPFVMTGPSANLAMQGSLDLVQETVDKDIEVALPVTGNIPLVSVLLGAPQVAGAVFLFDKLIGDPLAKFTTVKYHMSGDWSDPQINIEKAGKGAG